MLKNRQLQEAKDKDKHSKIDGVQEWKAYAMDTFTVTGGFSRC